MTTCPELAQLKMAVEGLDLPVDGDVLAEVFGVLDRLTAKVTAAAGEFDAAQLQTGRPDE